MVKTVAVRRRRWCGVAPWSHARVLSSRVAFALRVSCTRSGGASPTAVAGRAAIIETERSLSREERTRRVIFLDIDGVLAPIRRWDRYGDLDPACIAVLNDIIARAGADVVVSSTWRYGKTVAELQEMLDAGGFAGRVLDTTPIGGPGTERGDEIAAWLADNAVTGFVIIDDHFDMGALRTHLVPTHPGHGLRPEDGARAVATLMRATA